MLNLIGATSGMMAIAINLVAMASVLPLTFRQRLILAGAAGAWVGLATGLGQAGALAFSSDQPVPLIGVLASAPLVAAALGWGLFPGFRAALMGVPTPLLIRINALRVIGALFLILAVVGRLGGPFPYFAGIGDVITGVLAIPVARAAALSPGRGAYGTPSARSILWRRSPSGWPRLREVRSISSMPGSARRRCSSCRSRWYRPCWRHSI